MLTLDELRTRARRLKVLMTDCDGVLTDAGVYVSADNQITRRFSVRDGMGSARLRAAGIQVAIISGEADACIAHRADKLKLEHRWLGIKNKPKVMREEVLPTFGVGWDEVAYIGDDLNDLTVLGLVAEGGLTGAPHDAQPEVAAAVHYVTTRLGGHGAFREFAEWVLRLRGETDA